MEQNSSTHIVIITLLLLITVNLFVLDLKIFSPVANIKISDVSTVKPTQKPQLPKTDFCPESCVNLINQNTTSSSANLGSPQNDSTSVNIITKQTVESYIPLGSGSTSKNSWEDLTATETLITPSNYGKIKEAYFVASLSNPTQNGQVEAQIYNVTDKHPVWGSHVVMVGAKEQTINSEKIILDAGTKLYRVQLKSTLGYSVTLTNARIRIVSE